MQTNRSPSLLSATNVSVLSGAEEVWQKRFNVADADCDGVEGTYCLNDGQCMTTFAAF